MRQNGFITDREYAIAVDTPLKMSAAGGGTGDAPYFVDMVNDELQTRFENYDFQTQSYRIYTSLDPRLQRAANDAVKSGMQLVDELIAKQKHRKTRRLKRRRSRWWCLTRIRERSKRWWAAVTMAQSQLNHVLAKRQPGSIFKPFVYAAAMNSALGGSSRTLTPATTVVDEPTTFMFDNKPYSPGNFEHEFLGTVTLRKALAKSLNVATIKVAEMVGYGNVVNLAHRAGINEDVRPTPSMAIGSYEATPLEMAGAYTVFANDGVYVKPTFLDRCARARRRRDVLTAARDASGSGPPRELSDGQHARRSTANGNCRGGPLAGLYGSGSGEDRHLARWLVCRFHLAPVVHRVGWL